MKEDLAEKVILITGATSGIGRATATLFAELGACIVAVARSPRPGMALIAELEDLGSPEARFIATDVTIETQVEAMVDFTLSAFGRLDFAFNNAGIFIPESPFHEHHSDTWNRVISTNLSSVYTCMKYELTAMLSSIENGSTCGVIVNNASIIGHRGSAASGLAYTAAKHGVIGLTRQAAVTYADRSIRVNAVSPGPTLTAATRPRLEVSEEEAKARLATLNPTGELVPVEHIAENVAFLCTPAAAMINGQDIALDGGQLAKL